MDEEYTPGYLVMNCDVMCVIGQGSKGFGQSQNCLEDAPKARPLDPLPTPGLLETFGPED